MEESREMKNGIYKISLEEYRNDPCPMPSLSRSVILDLIYRSPAHGWYNHPRLNPDFKPEEGEKKFDIGEASHSLLLEGIDRVAVIEADDWRTKDAKMQREEARKNGLPPLLRHQYDSVLAMVLAAEKQIKECKELGATDLRKDGDSELSYFWKEEDIWLKVRPDWISKDRKIILDYKTTSVSANPENLARIIVNNGYDIQASLYVRGVKAIEGIESKFIFMFQETEEPYLCSFVGLPPDFMEMGKSKCDYGIFLWKECLSTNQWPGYPQRVCWIDRPEWAWIAWDKRAQNITGGENL
ncbi:MAG: hypothetical protein DDT33_00988 [Firmicutes bacterium]|nr:hypothetical protein [Bacillota bacterium]